MWVLFIFWLIKIISFLNNTTSGIFTLTVKLIIIRLKILFLLRIFRFCFYLNLNPFLTFLATLT